MQSHPPGVYHPNLNLEEGGKDGGVLMIPDANAPVSLRAFLFLSFLMKLGQNETVPALNQPA